MKLVSEHSSSWSHLSFAGFTYSSLLAWSKGDALPQSDRPKVTELAVNLKEAIDALLKEARESQDAIIFTRPAAQAAQSAALGVLAHRIKEALVTVQQKVGNNAPDHPIVRRFLPELLGTISKLPIADRPQEAMRAAARLKDLDVFDGRDEIAARLEASATAANDAIEGASAAYDGWRGERSEEVVAKGKLRLALEKTHRLLGAQFAGQRSLVESFFLRAGNLGDANDPGDAGDVPTDAPQS